MLFDLRGRGRRRTVQAIYLTLAILMGGGLVLFGIGGDVQGGLVDAFNEGGGDPSGQIADRLEQAEERTRTNPRDPAAFAALAQARYQAANTGETIDPATGAYTEQGREQLQGAVQAFERHVQLAGDRPDADLAAVITNAYVGLGRLDEAANAYSLVVGARDDPGAGEFARLATLYYQAGNTRQGDLAADRAVEVAPRGQRRTLRRNLEQLKAQATLPQGGAGGAGGAGGVPAPTP